MSKVYHKNIHDDVDILKYFPGILLYFYNIKDILHHLRALIYRNTIEESICRQFLSISRQSVGVKYRKELIVCWAIS